jgi:hypothetical protein
MRFLIILFLLSGCTETIKPVKEYERVIVYPPEQLLQIPPKPYSIDVDRMTQKDVAHWILSNEERTMQLESQIKLLKEFFEKVEDK